MRFVRALVAAAAVVASLPGDATAARPGRLIPSVAELQLKAGQSRSMDYTLQLEAEPPRPTDVYLLVDTSASMQPYLADLRRGIVGAMRSMSERDLRVGIGEFRTTSAADRHARLTYRLLRQVGTVDGQLAQAVDRLGRDRATLPQLPPGEGAHTVALDEAVTGDGHWPYVEPGRPAGFRPDARKVVVVVTDEAFAPDSMQPSRSDAIATLRAAGVEVFGLALHANALTDLTAVAAGTRSLADKTVHCGGSRYVRAGRPTACVVSPAAFVNPLFGMLVERRPGKVTVSVRGTGVRRLAPRAWTVDLNTANRMRFRLDVGCPASQAGTHEIVLTASVSGTHVAKALLTMHCGN